MSNAPSLKGLVRGMRDMRLASLPIAVAAMFGVGVYAFLRIADEVAEAEFDQFDRWLLLAFRNPGDMSDPRGPAWLEEFMIELTALGGYPLLTLIVVAVAGFLVVSGRYGPAVYTVLSIVFGTAVSHGLKLVYDRPRPDLVEQLVTVHTPSFPSGHASMSAVVYLTLATVIVRFVDGWAVRAYVLWVALLLTVGIGVSRVYLGVHWPSDVAAGWAFGVSWACLAWLVVTGLRAWHRGQNPS